MKQISKIAHIVLITACASMLTFSSLAVAQDLTYLGGELTNPFFTGRDALQVPAPFLSVEDRFDQANGFGPFHRKVTKDQGLGKFFNNNSCGGCHIENGKGPARVPFKNKRRQHAMLVKVSLIALDESGNPRLDETGAPITTADDGSPLNVPAVGAFPTIGEQLQEQALGKRRRRFNVRLRWNRVRGTYPDGTSYKLRKPKLRYRIRGLPRRHTAPSLRMTPGLVGMGLLEAIPESAILALSDPEDSNSDGISGRPQYIPNVRTNTLSLGRFGFRASHPTVEQQSAAAAFHDMGLTNTLFNNEDGEPEVSAEILRVMTIYQELANVPAARDQSNPEVIAGKNLFQAIGCNDCHVMTFVTESDNPALDNQTIHPFTDLLLHDMGDDLADTRAEFSASGREWRTTPLWGLGNFESVTSRRIQYLHDGRAQTVEQAILWHGGEAEASKQQFMHLSKAERDQLITFLRSL